MRVLIGTINEDVSLDAQPAKIFSTARAFLIYETNTKQFYSIKNTFYGAKEPHIAKDLKDLGIDNIIVEDICIGCYENLKREGIEIWEDKDSIYLRESLQKFELGGLFVKPRPKNFTMHKILEESHEPSLEEELKQYN